MTGSAMAGPTPETQSQRTLRNIPSISAGSFLTMPTQSRGRRRFRSKSFVGRAAQKAVQKSKQRTWIIPLILLTICIGWYLLDPTGSPVRYGIFLSYPVPGTDPVEYAKGPLDFVFCIFYALVFSFTREFVMQEILEPLGKHYNIRNQAKLRRFEEQAYTFLYFSVMGIWGLCVMRKTPMWYFNTYAFWEEYPHYTHVASFKAFYLVEAAYWIQQALVLALQLEKPRKDFKELVMHHIITLLLIGCSYVFHFTWIGLAVFITMDTSDILLAFTKCLNYLNVSVVYISFLIFVFVWIYMRHYLSLKIIWAVLTTMATVNSFELNWKAGYYKCWLSQYGTAFLLISLQVINLYWLFLILRIGYRAFTTQDTHDERSDDEDEGSSVEREPSNAKKEE
ncbi:sphingosine N-acyltransferase Lac1 [Schizosaccharomyces cryophilus OY26]|uniref:Sphingosine N-acyltransferase Lac1 n=1 Tax=Schizosaccharomyces cryophilus (strain OY26 / ATCC MYA-4695 / CBS 11777 / NBRC 106824 / NRRL Y48691) TaxID=653667 RepID=S9X9Q2_SCHCR|nr:sphingosine N-acyltransferase Lac1 [Schizosaccharomyces cryophilus OY26]EPY53877.1 sphingosine N-acyltransferase Lac1 [Schizosaccharomyces cryophilus OY26]